MTELNGASEPEVDLEDNAISEAVKAVQSFIDEAKRDQEEDPTPAPEPVTEKPARKPRVYKPRAPRVPTKPKCRENEEEEVAPKRQKRKILSDDDEELQDVTPSSENVILRQLIQKMSSKMDALTDEVKSAKKLQSSSTPLVLPASYNWKTTERTTKELHGLHQVFAGEIIFIFVSFDFEIDTHLHTYIS